MTDPTCQHTGGRHTVARVTHPHGNVDICDACGATVADNAVTSILIHLNIDVPVYDATGGVNSTDALIALAEAYAAAHGIPADDIALIDPIG